MSNTANKAIYTSATGRKDRIYVTFGITNPVGDLLTDILLVCHINPSELDEKKAKKIETLQTEGGWVQQHWGEEMDEISGTQSTGMFLDLNYGKTGEAFYRRNTIAYSKYSDLFDLYQSNGLVYDSSGMILFQGDVVINYGLNRYQGYFTNFSKEEVAEKPWLFDFTWTFKVRQGKKVVRLHA